MNDGAGTDFSDRPNMAPNDLRLLLTNDVHFSVAAGRSQFKHWPLSSESSVLSSRRYFALMICLNDTSVKSARPDIS